MMPGARRGRRAGPGREYIPVISKLMLLTSLLLTSSQGMSGNSQDLSNLNNWRGVVISGPGEPPQVSLELTIKNDDVQLLNKILQGYASTYRFTVARGDIIGKERVISQWNLRRADGCRIIIIDPIHKGIFDVEVYSSFNKCVNWKYAYNHFVDYLHHYHDVSIKITNTGPRR